MTDDYSTFERQKTEEWNPETKEAEDYQGDNVVAVVQI